MRSHKIPVQTIAEMCGVTVHAVHNWKKRGLLQSYYPEDVAEFLHKRWKLEILKELEQWTEDKKLEV